MSYRASPRARRLADRHYSRQTVGAEQFVPPGACLVVAGVESRMNVLITPDGKAYWVTSWPKAEYVHHAWAGAWICSAFRNEGAGLSSELIREAVAATRAHWAPPNLGMVTFVDADRVRRKRDPGRCFVRAGFQRAERCGACHGDSFGMRGPCAWCGEDKVGWTDGGLLAFQMLPSDMPPPPRTRSKHNNRCGALNERRRHARSCSSDERELAHGEFRRRS